jgi:hypothetical protein
MIPIRALTIQNFWQALFDLLDANKAAWGNLYVYAHVCARVCIYTCVCMYVCIYIRMYMYTCVYVCVYVCVCVCVSLYSLYIRMCTHTHTHIRMCTETHTYTHTHIHTGIQTYSLSMSTLEEVFLRLAEIDHANANHDNNEGEKGGRAGGEEGGATGGLGHVTQEQASSLAQVAVPVEDVWAELESFQCKKSALRQVDPCASLPKPHVCVCVCVYKSKQTYIYV